ncbi:HlyD family type I secretion periplasmic adaptor subunit [Paracoccus aminophilus]|uniref:Membrane fusion protein (MFP) family protein n=1 Tax=Paracoccus aminophilus JCM 7686 TaxID=1367847 RepID=S5XKA0_PARAH|nr:HlyD family type I secretion periplasmic adaptor subunit [Paracoccus aminophilus]AGT07614.1 HlyD family type I secretion membrane fusion protein [Paracoccus aminophilus JCM 7686]
MTSDDQTTPPNASPATARAPVEKLPSLTSPRSEENRSLRAQRIADDALPPLPPRQAPEQRWSARGSLITGFLTIFLLFGGFVLWASMSEISGAVVASGQVEVDQRRQVVQHPDGGVVSAILVKEGQSVKAGDPLILLDGTMLQTELAIVEGQYFEILARRGRLEAERAGASDITFPPELTEAATANPALAAVMAGQQSLFHARLDTLQQALGQLSTQAEQVKSQISGIDAQTQAQNEQYKLIQEELKGQKSLLDKGLAQSARVLALERETARLSGQSGELVSNRAQAVTRLTEIDLSKLEKTAEHREQAETELRDLGYRELELAERRRGLQEQIARLEIRAPVSGIVQELQVTTPRSVIRAAEPILYIIPQDRPLVISAKLATINIDEVHAGQPVVLRFSAFSSRTTPEIDGVLSRISPDSLIDEMTRAPYYRAEVTIPSEQIAKLGDKTLVPGMPVEVYIKTGDRTPIAYLMKPLSDYFRRAFREN